MYLLRILLIVVVACVVGGFVAYLLTRQKQYLHFAGKAFRYGVLVALLLFALMFLGRVFRL